MYEIKVSCIDLDTFIIKSNSFIGGTKSYLKNVQADVSVQFSKEVVYVHFSFLI